MESFWVQTAISAIRAIAFVCDVITFPVYLVLQRPWKRRQLAKRIKVSASLAANRPFVVEESGAGEHSAQITAKTTERIRADFTSLFAKEEHLPCERQIQIDSHHFRVAFRLRERQGRKASLGFDRFH